MAFLEQTKLTDAQGNVINPAQQPELYTDKVPDDGQLLAPVVRTAHGSLDDEVILLRRLLKLLESQAATDTAQRQRITLDAITSGLTLTTVTTVSNAATLAGYNQQLFADWARTAYNTGIRSGLTFS